MRGRLISKLEQTSNRDPGAFDIRRLPARCRRVESAATTAAALLLPFDFLLFSPVSRSHPTPKNAPADARAVFRRHKHQCAMTLVVLYGRLRDGEKVGTKWALFGDFREFFALQNGRLRWQR